MSQESVFTMMAIALGMSLLVSTALSLVTMLIDRIFHIEERITQRMARQIVREMHESQNSGAGNVQSDL